MREKIEGTILVADGIEGRKLNNGRFCGEVFGEPGSCARVGWDGMIEFATTHDRSWFAGLGTLIHEKASS